jgi:hypothetical protein
MTSEVNEDIRENTRDSDIKSEVLETTKAKYNDEIIELTREVHKIKVTLAEEEGIVDTLTEIQARKEEEIRAMNRLLVELKVKRKENVKISTERITRIEEATQKSKEVAQELRSAGENLIKTERILRGEPAIESFEDEYSPRATIPTSGPLYASSSNNPPAVEHRSAQLDPIPVPYYSPSQPKLYSPQKYQSSLDRNRSPTFRSPTAFSSHSSQTQKQAYIPPKKFEYRADLKAKINSVLNNIDRDLRK